ANFRGGVSKNGAKESLRFSTKNNTNTQQKADNFRYRPLTVSL
ncbi:MAG: hypothetical protein ACI8XX_000344, partial [Polaribacter sp.]